MPETKFYRKTTILLAMLSAELSRQLVFPIGIVASIFQFPRRKELRYIRYRGNGTPYKPVKIESLYDSFGLNFQITKGSYYPMLSFVNRGRLSYQLL